MKICKTCGREKHEGLCDMVELTDGRTVHASRVGDGGDLHGQLGEKLKIKRWWRVSLKEKLVNGGGNETRH